MTEIQIQRKLYKQSMWIECPKCKGEGWIDDENYDNHYTQCENCHGTSKIRKPQPKRHFKKTLLSEPIFPESEWIQENKDYKLKNDI
jgi:hypothetical protein